MVTNITGDGQECTYTAGRSCKFLCVNLVFIVYASTYQHSFMLLVVRSFKHVINNMCLFSSGYPIAVMLHSIS